MFPWTLLTNCSLRRFCSKVFAELVELIEIHLKYKCFSKLMKEENIGYIIFKVFHSGLSIFLSVVAQNRPLRMHNILQTFNILSSEEFIFVQISIQGWKNAAHLFPKPSGSNSITNGSVHRSMGLFTKYYLLGKIFEAA